MLATLASTFLLSLPVVKTSFQIDVDTPSASALWIPIPSNNPFQAIGDVKVEAPAEYRISSEPKFDNRMVYIQATGPIHAKVSFNVTRRAAHELLADRVGSQFPSAKTALTFDRLGPATPDIQQLGASLTAGTMDDREKISKVFHYITSTFHYDYKKQSEKLGEGDVAFMCDYRTGNCSDIHNVMITIARSQHIPAFIEYGLPVTGVPSKLASEGTVGGYHCWTWMELGDEWVPVDASDARRWLDSGSEAQANKLFGNLPPERSSVALSRGRDIDLSPRQAGPTLNYFVYPYAERDGKPVKTNFKITYHLLK